jgi:hypothetical protein
MRNENGQELHTEADKITPLSKLESLSMGRQTATPGIVNPSSQIVYGEVSNSVENEDQAYAHHSEPDEHL